MSSQQLRINELFWLGGKDDYSAVSGLFAALDQLTYAGINEDLLINLNDSGFIFLYMMANNC